MVLKKEPYRVEGLDSYSDILLVKEKQAPYASIISEACMKSTRPIKACPHLSLVHAAYPLIAEPDK